MTPSEQVELNRSRAALRYVTGQMRCLEAAAREDGFSLVAERLREIQETSSKLAELPPLRDPKGNWAVNFKHNAFPDNAA